MKHAHYYITLFFGFLLFQATAQIPFTCEGQFLITLSKNGDSKLVKAEIDPNSNVVNFSVVNNSMGVDINAIGYRNKENLVYGIDPNRHFLYRVDARGSVETLTRLPLDIRLSYFAADITPDGNFLILIGGTGTAFFGSDVEMVKVDLTDPSYPVDRQRLTGPNTRIYDIAFNPLTGELYGFDSNNERLVLIDPENAEVFANYASTANVDNAGSLFFDAFGNLYAYGGPRFSEQNRFYSVDVETGEFTVLTSGPNAEGTDACSCPYTLEMTKIVEPRWSYPCEEVEYIFAVANGSGATLSDLTFRDELPDGFTLVDVIENPFGGVVVSPLGSDRVVITDLEVPPGIDTIRVLVNVGQANAGIILNQARMEGLPVSLGTAVKSDDPRTLARLDSTYLEIRRIPFDTMNISEVICDGDSLLIDLSQFGRSFEWDDGMTSPFRTFDMAGNFEVKIIAGCDTALVTYDILAEDIDVSLSENELFVKLGDTVVLRPNIFNTGDSTIIVWLDPDGHEVQCGECSFYELLPLKSGTYIIQVTNEFGCTDTDEVYIEVDNTRDIFVPNVFSPNFDNINDRFFIEGLGFGKIENILVFDRWGEVVYRSQNIWINDESMGWDGRFNGDLAPPGVYAWMAEITFLDNVTEIFSGDLTLLR